MSQTLTITLSGKNLELTLSTGRVIICSPDEIGAIAHRLLTAQAAPKPKPQYQPTGLIALADYSPTFKTLPNGELQFDGRVKRFGVAGRREVSLADLDLDD